MELVPSIANFFNVTIDELFGCTADRERKINELIMNITEKNRRNNGEDICIEECITMVRDGLVEFPGNERLLLCLATLLYNAGYARYGEHHLADCDGYDIYDTERHKGYLEWQEAIRIYEKLLPSLREGELRQQAVRELIQLYVNTGEYEKATKIAENAPDLSGCRPLLLLNTCDGKARAEAYADALCQLTRACADLLVSTVMVNKGHLPPETAVRTIENAAELFRCISDNGFPVTLSSTEQGHLSRLMLYLSEHRWRAGDHDGAFAALDDALNYAKAAIALDISCTSTNLPTQLPELWPWWCVPDFTQTKAEMMADPRWDRWVSRCCQP